MRSNARAYLDHIAKKYVENRFFLKTAVRSQKKRGITEGGDVSTRTRICFYIRHALSDYGGALT